MKKKTFSIAVLISILLLTMISISYSKLFKWIKIGSLQVKVVDNTDWDQISGSRQSYYYYNGFTQGNPLIYNGGWHLAARNWTDPDGTTWPVKVTGTGTAGANETSTVPLENEDGSTIRMYFRNEPPTIEVDGELLQTPFPLKGDELAPEKIIGSADVMLESRVNTFMGLSLHQRVFAWSHAPLDNVVIYDWTFKNTGNVDADPDIELDGQNLEDVYFMYITHFWRENFPWYTTNGERTGEEDIRMMYAYPSRSEGSNIDDFGIYEPYYSGLCYLHVDQSATDHTNDPSQPRMTGCNTVEIPALKAEASQRSASDLNYIYGVMQNGFDDIPFQTNNVPLNSKHNVRMDESGVKFPNLVDWWDWRACTYSTIGPYDNIAFGDSIRIVFALVAGSISREVGAEVMQAWANETCAWDGPNNLPAPFQSFPDLYDNDNDYAKDCWVATGKDSLMKNALAALDAFQNGYDIPTPPQAPSVRIQSQPDRIHIEWGTESESDPNFAGYRLYRTVANPDNLYEMIYECGSGTDNPITVNQYDDMEYNSQANPNGVRAQTQYFYYVTAMGTNGLESGRFLNRNSAKRALQTTKPGHLGKVRVVPNPYNLSAGNVLFPGESNKIAFFHLPPECTIKIFTESGDLVKTIDHTDRSGSAYWGGDDPEGFSHMRTDNDQRPASGLYIYVVETPSGAKTTGKFVIIR